MTKSEAALLSALSEWAIDAYGGEPFPFDGKAFDVLLGKLNERNIGVRCGPSHDTHCIHWFDAQPCCDCDAELIRGMVAGAGE